MERSHQENSPYMRTAEQEVFAECQKQIEGTGLAYTSGQISVQGSEATSMYCLTQLWDSGADFNVVAVWLLVRLLGKEWRRHMQPLIDSRSARMATGHLAQALGTIVLQMDWTVAPDDNDLRCDSLGAGTTDTEPLRVIRIPIRFLVFDKFEIPIILAHSISQRLRF